MNLQPPPQIVLEAPPEMEDEKVRRYCEKLYDTISQMQDWHESLYEFLKYPVFHVIRFYPRASKASRQEGDLYYDSDTDKMTLGVAAAWETVASTGAGGATWDEIINA